MPPFRAPKERLDFLATELLKTLQGLPGVEIRDAEAAKGVFRAVLTENLQAEHALEEEAMQMLRAYGQEIFSQKADFQKLLHEGKKILAKKKGFIL